MREHMDFLMLLAHSRADMLRHSRRAIAAAAILTSLRLQAGPAAAAAAAAAAQLPPAAGADQGPAGAPAGPSRFWRDSSFAETTIKNFIGISRVIAALLFATFPIRPHVPV